ncbi:MAG TPA: acetylglutamate kinase [Thermoplasmata archaeon]|nr:acetylglutamate kinase [Thermoplasmata archaeon]
MRDRPGGLVVKVGGHLIREGAPVARIAQWVAALAAQEPVIVVHGGGEDADQLLERLQLPTPKIDGVRVTDAKALPVVAGVLAGTVNLRVVSALGELGVPAIGLTGASHRAVFARPAGEPPGSLGFVGEPTRTDVGFIRRILSLGWVPVFAPVAVGEQGGYLNVNADLFAARIASDLSARLLEVTDVPGVCDKEGRLIPRLRAHQIPSLVEDGTITAGMIPKVRAAERAVREGVVAVWIGTLGPSGGPDFERGTWVEAGEMPDRTWIASPLPAATLTRHFGGET